MSDKNTRQAQKHRKSVLPVFYRQREKCDAAGNGGREQLDDTQKSQWTKNNMQVRTVNRKNCGWATVDEGERTRASTKHVLGKSSSDFKVSKSWSCSWSCSKLIPDEVTAGPEKNRRGFQILAASFGAISVDCEQQQQRHTNRANNMKMCQMPIVRKFERK